MFALALLALLAMLPFAAAAWVRSAPSPNRPIHLVQDMDYQPRFDTQTINPLFADGRAMRPQIPGVVAVGESGDDVHFSEGTVDGQWAATTPGALPRSMALLERGQNRFAVYCTPCHGLSGHGDGMVPRRSAASEYGAWVVSDLSSEKGLAHPIGEIFNIIGYGINTMPGYRAQVPPEDRWALVAHVKSIQYSQSVDIAEIPEKERKRLEELPIPAGEDSEAAPDQESGTDSRQGR